MYGTVSILDKETVLSYEARLQNYPGKFVCWDGRQPVKPLRFPLYGRVTGPRFDLLPLEDSTTRRLFEASQRIHEIENCQFFLRSVYGDGNCLCRAASIAITGSSDEHWRTFQVGRSLQMN